MKSVDEQLLPPGVTRHLVHSPTLGGSGSSTSGAFRSDSGFRFEVVPATPEHPANAVSARCTDGLYRPLIDFDDSDIEAGLLATSVVFGVSRRDLVAVNSKRNWHIYVPTVALTWDGLVDALHELLEVRVLNSGYVNISVRDGGCYLRLPGSTPVSVSAEPVLP